MNEVREITTISFGRATREKRGMYLSSDDTEAIHLGLREVYVNSLDALSETNAAKGNVYISIDSKERRVFVEDDGPGIPNKTREDGTHSLVAAYTMPHTGSHNDGRQVSSIGVNGVGASIVTHTASKLVVGSNDGTTVANAVFESDEDGAHLISFEEIRSKHSKTGVSTSYYPDPSIYHDAWFDKKYLTEELSEMMKFYPKYKVVLNFDGSKQTFYYPNGLKESNTQIYADGDNFIISLHIAKENDGEVKPFGNRLYLPNGGAFFTYFKTTLTKNMKDLSGLNLTGAQIMSMMSGYVAIFVSNPLFTNQSKTAISNKEVNAELGVALKNALTKFSKTPEWETLIKKLETEIKAEEAAERARTRIKNSLNAIKSASKKKTFVAEKLKDCINHGEDAWLAITEGNSAQSSLNLGRDVTSVATFPIRGKFINCLKNSREKFLENEELQQIASILGCGLFEEYNARKLKYGKVLIAVDADEDGKNIADLLITFFYVCMPNFIKEGRLYWMKAPLYYNDAAKQYIFTEEEWSKVKNKSAFTRAKGLGEQTPESVKESLFGASKHWEPITPANWKDFSETVVKLMGKDVSERRDFIFKNVDFERIKFL